LVKEKLLYNGLNRIHESWILFCLSTTFRLETSDLSYIERIPLVYMRSVKVKIMQKKDKIPLVFLKKLCHYKRKRKEGKMMKKYISSLLITVLLVSICYVGNLSVSAETRFIFSGAFGSHMVLQQNRDFDVFGFGESGRSVTVTLKKGDTVLKTEKCTITKEGKWAVSFPAIKGSLDTYTLIADDGQTTRTLSDVLFGEVWIAGGQSNMQLAVKESVESTKWEHKARNDYIRFYKQSAQTTNPSTQPLSEPIGSWTSAKNWGNVLSASAIAYYFAENLYAQIKVPIGIIHTAVGSTTIATWMDTEAVKNNPELDTYLKDTGGSLEATLFNTRIASFAGIGAAGIIWCQGETDISRDRYIFEKAFPTLVSCWSRVFGRTEKNLLPFIAVQLAHHTYSNPMAVPIGNESIINGVKAINDLGGKAATVPVYDLPLEWTSHPLHPHTKEPVGERCAHAALGIVYNQKEIFCGPEIKSAVQNGNVITLTFNYAGFGLRSSNNRKLTGFKVTGRDGSTTDVNAAVKSKNTIEIVLDSTETVDSVEYAFYSENNDCNLYNKNGYYALPFHMPVTVVESTPSSPSVSNTNTSTSSNKTNSVSAKPVGSDVESVASTVSSSANAESITSTEGSSTPNNSESINSTNSNPPQNFPWIPVVIIAAVILLGISGALIYICIKRSRR